MGEGDGLARFRIHRTNDYLFKRIFSSEEVLLGFLNAVFKPPVGKELVKLTLLDREIDPQHVLDRGARLDILARTEEGHDHQSRNAKASGDRKPLLLARCTAYVLLMGFACIKILPLFSCF
jgi:hypothetical protein